MFLGPATETLAWCSFYARCASCHDFDVAFPGRLRRAAVGVLGYSARAPTYDPT